MLCTDLGTVVCRSDRPSGGVLTSQHINRPIEDARDGGVWWDWIVALSLGACSTSFRGAAATKPPRREPASYFVGPRCVFVCVLCLFVCALSSRCLVCRPSHLCVCRVKVSCWHPSGALKYVMIRPCKTRDSTRSALLILSYLILSYLSNLLLIFSHVTRLSLARARGW